LVDTKKTRLESKIVGSIPVINHFIEKLDLEATFTRFLPREPRRGRRSKIPPAQTLLVLLRNLIVDKLALYRIPDWVRGHVPQLFGLNEGDIDSFTDERLGKALDLLYQADRRSLITQVVREAVRVFKVELRQIHNDTTTISFFGKYEGQEFLGTVLLCRGFNKDHRPDLKQLVFSVCASADEDVPVHLGLFDGNTTDDQIHCAIWDDLREFIGHSDFIYVGDCKLCTHANMAHIDSRQGKFITVLPRTRKEDGEFRDWVQENQIPWDEEKKLPNPRKESEPPHIFKVFESPRRSAEGYRLIWVWDSLKAAHDALTRKEHIDDAVKGLQEILGKIGKRNLKTRKQVEDAVARILVESQAASYINAHVEVEQEKKFKQARPGRPSDATPYRSQLEEKVALSWIENVGFIRWESKTDGLFPLITNIEKDGTTRPPSSGEQKGEGEFSPMRILDIYKYQPNVEKLHSMLKSFIRAMPVWLKKVRRIEALMPLIFIALLISTLIQRQLRIRMERAGIEELPLYPDDKECKRPTARIILEQFERQRRNRLYLTNRLQQTFWDPLTSLQKEVLRLIGVDSKEYGHKRTERY
jgi:transposase